MLPSPPRAYPSAPSDATPRHSASDLLSMSSHPPSPRTSTTTTPPPPEEEEQVLQQGPAFWAARRLAWRTSPDGRDLDAILAERRRATATSNGSNGAAAAAAAAQDAQSRLVTILDEPGAEEDDRVWESGLDQVWQGLVTGVRLKRPLPLPTAVSIYDLSRVAGGRLTYTLGEGPACWMAPRRHLARRRPPAVVRPRRSVP
jgi:hypothetical protein